MKKFLKYISYIIIGIFTINGIVFAVNSISGLDQNVSTGDIITSTWYNAVNKMIGGPHVDGGTCVYNSGKIICANVSTPQPTTCPVGYTYSQTYSGCVKKAVSLKGPLDCSYKSDTQEASWYRNYGGRCPERDGVDYRINLNNPNKYDLFVSDYNTNCSKSLFSSFAECSNSAFCGGDIYITNTEYCKLK